MHERAGGCRRAAGVASLLACSLALVGADCGSARDAASSTAATTQTSGGAPVGAATHRTTTTAAPRVLTTKPLTPADRKMAAIVNAWSVRLNRSDNRGLAELYKLPALVIQAPYAYRLRTRSEVALFFSELPCSGKVIKITYQGKYATAVFRLGNRGTTPCDAPGMLAAARFEIVDGKIVAWAQVPVPKGAAAGGQIA
jgi:hypothetical protein